MKLVSRGEYETILDMAISKIGMSMESIYEVMGKSVAMHIPMDERVIYFFIGNSKKGRAGLHALKYVMCKDKKVKIYVDTGLDKKYLAFLDMFKLKYEFITKNMEINEGIIVDAMYYGAIDATIKSAVEKINQSSSYVISIDSPTGTELDNGKIYDDAVLADKTISFITPKYSNIIYPAADYSKELIIEDIGIPHHVYDGMTINIETIDHDYIKSKIRKRAPWAHKGDFGRGILISGSTGMSGAAVLASKGALRSGIGILNLVIPESLNTIVKSSIPEVITMPMGEIRNGVIGVNNIAKIIDFTEANDVICFGPGCGVSSEMYELLKGLILGAGKPLVIDADGLNILSKNVDLLLDKKGPVILTPHIGEMTRLTGLSKEEILEHPINTARKYAQKWDTTIVLKSGRTVIATPDGKAYINLTGNPGMATAGSGDILAGIITSFIAQKYSLLDSLLLAVYIHGYSGDIASQKKSEYSMISGDIVEELSSVFRILEV